MNIVVRVDNDTKRDVNGNISISGSTTYYSKMSQISDGHHTFEELYQYRMLLQAAWFNSLYAAATNEENTPSNPHNIIPVKSYRHHDGELCFGKENYFIVVAELPAGQISNHYKGEYWDLFDIPEVEHAPEWDGHTPAVAADRIQRYVLGKDD